MEKGTKYDKGKPRMDLIPRSALVSMGKGFAYGANKYDDRNWEKGIEFGRLFAALQRHLWAYWEGNEIDDESGLNHLDHAFCCLAMLNEMKNIRPDLDDRLNNKIKETIKRRSPSLKEIDKSMKSGVQKASKEELRGSQEVDTYCPMTKEGFENCLKEFTYFIDGSVGKRADRLVNEFLEEYE